MNVKNTNDRVYLDLIENVLVNGNVRHDRTGTGTVSKFGVTCEYDLSRQSIPLLTTKKMYWKGVVEELLWFISGCTDSKILSSKGVKIWDLNTSTSFLEKRKLTHYREGDAGPIYGFQWRHYGAKYEGCEEDYTGKGIDQLLKCVDLIRNDPYSRRIVMTAWNPLCIDEMVLPPCHISVQFYVEPEEDTLSCMMVQRSGDIGLGVPFNIASYGLLTHIIAHCCGLKAKKLVHTMNHVDDLRKQTTRKPYASPYVRILSDSIDIDAITARDIMLCGYKHHEPIPLNMSV